jgi:glycosyltransferase involved in cell wall biosynthesis
LNKNCLYLTFDGISDPLGQSQILPYLCGIAQRGYAISILSCEKPQRLHSVERALKAQLKALNISWHYILYNESGSSLSRFAYVQQLYRLSKKLHAKQRFHLVHCRSYLTALVGLRLKKKFDIPFVFDMRGLWADERIDGGIWSLKNPLHRFFYLYFKRTEKTFLKKSDAVVMLTSASLRYLDNKFPNFKLPSKTSVIPCCTDINVFQPNVKKAIVKDINATDHVLVYTGSIGTWYYTKEVIDCVLVWKQLIPTLKLLIVTKDTDALAAILKNYTSEQQALVVHASASYQDVPSYLKLAKATLFFIKPAFSKIASSPTKMAECWAVGLPVITNSGIGDNDTFIKEHRVGILINDFNTDAYLEAGRAYLQFIQKENNCRDTAVIYFNKDLAVDLYTKIYRTLCKN